MSTHSLKIKYDVWCATTPKETSTLPFTGCLGTLPSDSLCKFVLRRGNLHSFSSLRDYISVICFVWIPSPHRAFAVPMYGQQTLLNFSSGFVGMIPTYVLTPLFSQLLPIMYSSRMHLFHSLTDGCLKANCPNTILNF